MSRQPGLFGDDTTCQAAGGRVDEAGVALAARLRWPGDPSSGAPIDGQRFQEVVRNPARSVVP